MHNVIYIFCLSFIFGTGLGLWFSIDFLCLFIVGGISVPLFLIYLFKKKALLLLVGLFLLAISLGSGWAEIRTEKLNELYGRNLSKETELRTQVISEKEIREKYSRYVIKTGDDKILLMTDRDANYKYGDILRAKGMLEIPSKIDDFDYQGYLAKDDIYYQMRFPETDLIEESLGTFVSFIHSTKSKIRKQITRNFSEREAIFLKSIILGDGGLINEEFRESLSRSGTSHVVAISGLHLSVLSMFILGGLLAIGLWRKQASTITIIILIFFAVFIGFKASLMRAVFMASLMFTSLSLGKIFQGERIITYGAFLMLLYNPLLLRYDVGFQMSFLAVLGIFLLKPFFDYLFNKKLKLAQILSDVLTVTLAAQIFTLPIIVYNFGTFSLVAPIVNFFILLILPFSLGLGFLWALLSIFINPYILTLILQPLLKAILNFIYWTGSLSWSAIEISNNISIVLFVVYYISLFLVIIWWRRHYKKHLTPLALWKVWR